MTIRVDLRSGLTHAKLDVPPLTGDDVLGFTYTPAVGKIGTFQLTVAADALAAQNAIAGRELWFYDGNWPVFKGIIRTREISADKDGKLTATLVGPSISDQLIGLTTGRGLSFEATALSSVVTTLLGSTDFAAGNIDTATITARRFDGRTKWDALMAVAQAVDANLREDLLSSTTPKVDIGAFGTSCGITLRNFPESSESLSGNPYMKQIGSIKVKAQSLDLCNRVVPWGQIEGLSGLQLNLGAISSDNPSLTTRLYLPSTGTAPISPAMDSGWEKTSDVTVFFPTQARMAVTDRISSSMADNSALANDNSVNQDYAFYQYLYGPLGVQTFGGTVKGQILANEGNATYDNKLQMSIRVVSSDGLTVRGTVLPMGTYGNEMNTTQRNLTFPATALTAVASQAGDYLVIEIGVRQTAAVFGDATLRVGDNGTTDLPEDETTTTNTYNPWIQFSQQIALGAALPSGAAYQVQRGTAPDGSYYYYIEDTASQAIYGVRERWVQFKDILPLGLTTVDFQAAAQTLYGMAVTYLTRHLAEQVAYEVDVMALRHVNPDTGVPYFKVGDTIKLQFDGWTQDSDGNRTSYLNVDENLYILDFTVTYDSAGTPVTKLTLATFLRALPTDGEAFRQLAQAVGIEQVAPLAYIVFGDGFMRIDPRAIQLLTDAGTPLAAMYWAGQFQDSPSTAYPRAELSGYSNGTASALLQMLAYKSATTYASIYAFTGIATNPQTGVVSQTPTYSAGISTVALESSAAAAMKLMGQLWADIEPLAQITSNQNDYAVGAAYRSSISISSDAARDITGILATSVNDGALLFITNTGSFNITLKDASGSSSAANRMALNGDIILTPDGGCILQYNTTSSRWRALTKP